MESLLVALLSSFAFFISPISIFSVKLSQLVSFMPHLNSSIRYQIPLLSQFNLAKPRFFGRPGGNRTPNLRFWRPPLCQLSYWPILLMEPTTGIEPVTSSLPRKCSTTEPCGPLHHLKISVPFPFLG